MKSLATTKTALQKTAPKKAKGSAFDINADVINKAWDFLNAREAYATCHDEPTKTQKALASSLNKAHKALDSKIHKLWCDAFDAPENED